VKNLVVLSLGFEVNVIAIVHSALPNEISPPNKTYCCKQT